MLRIDVNASEYAGLGNLYAAAGKRAPVAIRRAVKEKGDKARTQVRRVARDAFGIKYRAASRYIQGRMLKSDGAGAAYEVRAFGRIPLKYTQTRQTPSGVVLKKTPVDVVDGKDKLPIAFGARGRSGVPGNNAKRVATLKGHIYARTGKGRAIALVPGISMPKVMLEQASRSAFEKVAKELPAALARNFLVVIQGLDKASGKGRARFL